MERNIQRNGLINLLALLMVGAAGFAVARYANSLAGLVSILFLGIGLLVSAVSWFQMRLEESERLEKLEFDELLKSRSGSALFEAKDAEAFPAQRSREQFEKYVVPGFTVLLCLLEGGGAYLLWRWLHRSTTRFELKEAMVALSLFGLFALFLFMLGKFSAARARLERHRLLRPGASYLLLGAYLCFVVALGIVGVQAGFSRTDFYVANVFCGLQALIALETLINLILEMYRPRVKGKVQRPLYDSRFVGLLGQPEGLITTAAQALDYQFGFKVSETWFYRFFERALGWLLLAQVGALVLSTAVVFIEAGEQGILERFGKPVSSRTVLGPGAHAKWPWPIDKVYRYRTEQIQSFDVGFTPDPAKEKEAVVVWTVAHTKEENFLVANREKGATAAVNQGTGKRTPPLSMVTVSIPVQFQITDLIAWVYNNEDAPALLQDLATREVVRYLTSADLAELMSSGREQAAQTLIERIQAAADQRRLGARIAFVGLQDMHPPVKVAPDFEKVVSAIHNKQAKILAARADDIRTNAMAQAHATNVLNTATTESLGRQIGALARAALFTNQIPAFEAAPKVYAERNYLETFARATANARKYIILTTNTQDVLIFDLQDKIRGDLLGELSVQPKK
jgi:regulator of protease activity HflC (stomatin/prohibitin superfamily)